MTPAKKTAAKKSAASPELQKDTPPQPKLPDPPKKAPAKKKAAPPSGVSWKRVNPQRWETEDGKSSVVWGKTDRGNLTWVAQKGDKRLGSDEVRSLDDAKALVEK